MFDLNGKGALVTGASGGLGGAIARALHRQGARVALSGTRREALERLASELGEGAFVLPADLSDIQSVEALPAAAEAALGTVDILVNNAGIGGPAAPAEDVTLAQWEEVIDINLTGAFLCAREAIKTMKAAKRGRIVNISSMAGRIGYGLRSPYGASKWGMIGFSRALAVELGPYNVSVNAVLPGAVEGDRDPQADRDRGDRGELS